MGRLIPLRLQPFQADTKTSSPSTSTSVAPTKSIDGQCPGAVIQLSIFPYTAIEWRKVMEEVKILYLKRQYKRCSARGAQILDNINDPYRVHPLYQLYLSFFAASSLELTSRSLHLNSSNKLPLLQQALTYYQNATSLIEYASFSADPTLIRAARETRKGSIDSTTSSVRSSIDSIFSTSSSRSSISAVSSTETSPKIADAPCYSLVPSTSSDVPQAHKHTVSAPSTQPQGLAPAPLKIKKKVAFSLQLQLPIHILSDDELALASPSTLISAFPNPPTGPATISAPPSPVEASSISDFLLSRALTRYSGQLSSFQEQLKYHVRSVEEQINGLHKARKAQRNNLSDVVTEFGDERRDGQGKKIELRQRIERLKAEGWKRKRFDGSRYQELCEKALVELD